MVEDLEKLSDEDLYQEGVSLGKLAQHRPDIVHRLLLGFRDELQRQGKFENFGDILWMLWRRGEHECQQGSLRIPFAPLTDRPSGIGPKK